MSWWIEKPSKTKAGRTELISVSWEPMLPMIAFCMIVMLGHVFAAFLITAGFSLFLAAKLSVITRGVYVSWGSKRMSPAFRRCYRCGYGLMFVGVVAGFNSLRFGL